MHVLELVLNTLLTVHLHVAEVAMSQAGTFIFSFQEIVIPKSSAFWWGQIGGRENNNPLYIHINQWIIRFE